MPEQNDREPNFAEWLGWRKSIKLSEAPRIGRCIGFLIALLFVLFVPSIVIILGKSFSTLLGTQIKDGTLLRNLAFFLTAIIGAPFLVWRTIVAAKQVNISQETLQNEKISDTMNQLSARYEVTERIGRGHNTKIIKEWKDGITTRVAAIDRLEGLVHENNELAPRIVRLLATYTKTHFPAPHTYPSIEPCEKKVPRADLQMAVSTIGNILHLAYRNNKNKIWRLNLSHCNFDGVDFSGGNFYAVDFSYGRFEHCNFNQGNYKGCVFTSSLLNYSQFVNVNLLGANFSHVVYEKSYSDGITFFASDSRGLIVANANLKGIKNLGFANNIRLMFANEHTQLSEELREAVSELRTSGTLYPFWEENEQLETITYNQLLDSLPLTGFPYRHTFS